MSNTQVINLPASTPAVPITFVTDSGNAVAAANILNVLGADGVTTEGAGNTITVRFAGATIEGTGQTVDAATADLVTVTPTDLKSFTVQAFITGYDAVNDETVGGELIGGGRKNTTVTIVSDAGDLTKHTDAALNGCNMELVASGADFVIQVTGVLGRTIDWAAVVNYVSSP